MGLVTSKSVESRVQKQQTSLPSYTNTFTQTSSPIAKAAATDDGSGNSTGASNNDEAATTTVTTTTTSQGGGCPMKRADGSYAFSWKALVSGFQHPGGNPPRSALSRNSNNSNGVDEEKSSDSSRVGQGQSGCPVKHVHPEYNVYSQPIDPSNNMPGTANQSPTPQQTQPLSTERVVSTIPKGGADGEKKWTYPSPQMFYNALARKGKLHDTEEADMEHVVAVHNSMNEMTWRKVLQWEHLSGYDDVKLLRFQGRPTDLSPKALFKSKVLGHPLPFDRHDWVVLRENNSVVRYVIDYYYNESPAQDEMSNDDAVVSSSSTTTDLHAGAASPSSLLVDVRPALDGPAQLFDRTVRMPLARHVFRSSSFDSLPMLPSTTMKTQVPESIQVWNQIQSSSSSSSRSSIDDLHEESKAVTDSQARALAQQFARVQTECTRERTALNACTSDDDYAKASLDWTMCASPIVCSVQHQALQKALQDSAKDDSIPDLLKAVSECVAIQSSRKLVAKAHYPSYFSE